MKEQKNQTRQNKNTDFNNAFKKQLTLVPIHCFVFSTLNLIKQLESLKVPFLYSMAV